MCACAPGTEEKRINMEGSSRNEEARAVCKADYATRSEMNSFVGMAIATGYNKSKAEPLPLIDFSLVPRGVVIEGPRTMKKKRPASRSSQSSACGIQLKIREEGVQNIALLCTIITAGHLSIM